MALSIQSNASSMGIQNQLNKTNNSLATALERLGSGYRINSSKDDAAGLQIANRLNAQSTGQSAALYNANNAMTPSRFRTHTMQCQPLRVRSIRIHSGRTRTMRSTIRIRLYRAAYVFPSQSSLSSVTTPALPLSATRQPAPAQR